MSVTLSNGNEMRMRLRRTNSTSKAEDIVTEDAKVRKSQPDKPIHSPRDSLISGSSAFSNYEGMVNWAFLLLAMGGLRLALENINKYGLRVDLTGWIGTLLFHLTHNQGEFPTLYLSLYTNVPVLLILLLEKLIAKDYLAWRLGMFLHMSNLFLMLVIPIVVINVKSEFIGVYGATWITVLYAVLFLKMWSYIQVNHWCRCSITILGQKRVRFQSIYRQASMIKDKNLFNFSCDNDEYNSDKDQSIREKLLAENQATKPTTWPNNLTVFDIYYFWFAPTLCYELNFPRTSRIRTTFLFRRGLEVIVGLNLVMAIVQQYIIPSVVNSLMSFATMDVNKASERLLKLALPNHLLWLVCFYLLFHSFLNTLGELLQFADRDFYHDWWNASNLAKFWSLWNLPVHRWCVRHLYKPLVTAGNSRTTATIIVFATSAFFHEYLISVPLRLFKIWGFLGMLVQAPLFPVSKFIEKHFGPRLGNVFVWISLILGQPLAVMMYYHDYVVDHFGEEEIQAFADLKTFHNASATVQ